MMNIVLFEPEIPANTGNIGRTCVATAPNVYTDVSYEPNAYIMFGKERAGIPEEILLEHKETAIRIPMIGDIRSLNLGNSVAIVLYEALRQNNFDHMRLQGELHHHSWSEAK